MFDPSVTAAPRATVTSSDSAEAKEITMEPDHRGSEVTLLEVQSQLAVVAQHVSYLQGEVLRQRQFLAEGVSNIRQWTVDAVREAVVQEASHGRRLSSGPDGAAGTHEA